MKILLENWRQYLKEEEEQQAVNLVEEIWAGNYVTEILIIEDQQRLLNEGIGSFFKNSFDAVKTQIQNLNNWKDNQLMAFIDSSLKKLQDFFSSMRSIAVKLNKEKTTAKAEAERLLLAKVTDILQKLFPKYRTRQIVQAFGVLRKPKYLKAGAAILAIVGTKLAELGLKAILDAMAGGAATVVKIADFVQKNVEKIKLLIQTVFAALDPNGLLLMLKDLAEAQGWLQILVDLQKDLKDPFKGFQRELAAS